MISMYNNITGMFYIKTEDNLFCSLFLLTEQISIRTLILIASFKKRIVGFS